MARDYNDRWRRSLFIILLLGTAEVSGMRKTKPDARSNIGVDGKSNKTVSVIPTSALQTQGGVDPLFTVGIVAGALYVLTALTSVGYRTYRNRKLRTHKKRGLEDVEEERLQACGLLKSIYSNMLFKHHGLQVVMRAMVNVNETQDTDEAEQNDASKTWTKMLGSYEEQLIVLFNALGSPMCRDPVVLPDLKVIKLAQRDHGEPLPDHRLKATALLIPAVSGRKSGPLADQEGSAKKDGEEQDERKKMRMRFVSRLVAFLDAKPPAEPSRSGLLWVEDEARPWWFVMDMEEKLLLKLPTNATDFAEPAATVKFASLQYVSMSNTSVSGRPCLSLKLTQTLAPSLLCHGDLERLREWQRSLNFHRCLAFFRDSQLLKDDCSAEQESLKYFTEVLKWESLDNTPPENTRLRDWTNLPWRQRALDADLTLRCQSGTFALETAAGSPQRTTGVLAFDKFYPTSPPPIPTQRYYFLLRGDRLSWYRSLSSTEAVGSILVRNLEISKVQLHIDGTNRCFQLRDMSGKLHKLTSPGRLACAYNAQAAAEWVDKLNEAYAQTLQMKLFHGRVWKGEPVKSGKVIGLVMNGKTKDWGCKWEVFDLRLYRDRFHIRAYDTGKEFMVYLADIIPRTLKFDQADDGGYCTDLPRDAFEIPHFKNVGVIAEQGGCVSFMFRGQKNHRTYFCGLIDDGEVTWRGAMLKVLRPYKNEIVDSPRHDDPKWGEMLAGSPVDSQWFIPLMNKVLQELPDALHVGVAPLCPPSCNCPIYARPLPLEDVLAVPGGNVRFELRICGASTQIRNILYHLDLSDPPVLELRLRGSIAIGGAESLVLNTGVNEDDFTEGDDDNAPVNETEGDVQETLEDDRENAEEDGNTESDDSNPVVIREVDTHGDDESGVPDTQRLAVRRTTTYSKL
jgi:hypothetical protein